SDPALMQTLRTTQENLLALQRLSEQTAQLHRQFLEGQDKALEVFRDLLQQQKKLLSGDLAPPLPNSIKVERIPPAKPAPLVAGRRPAAPEQVTEAAPEPNARPPKEPA